jgi:hypothetical protein
MGIKLRTDWKLEPGGYLINHHSKILLIGSCFSEHISGKLKFSGFDVFENPHGILFHPLAIERTVSDCLQQTQYRKEDLVFNGELWTSLNHHGRFNNPDPQVVLDSINASIRKAHIFLKNTSHLVLTLGTSWAYRHVEKESLVANCHKIPQKEFKKELLSREEIVASLERTVSRVREVNPEVAIILTVSPVRHIKDGMVENTLSKARLHESIHQLKAEKDGISYFPAYELMMDDLRDYRFYKSDLIHPSETAVEYIWERFSDCWIDPSANQLMQEARSIHRGLKHRPLQASSGKHREFQEKIERQILELKEKYPALKIYQD